MTNLNPSNDLIKGINAARIWGTLGWFDIKQRYRRSVLGPFWITLSTAVMVGVLGALYSLLLKQDFDEYIPFLAVGFVVWQFISTSILEGCSVFIASDFLIKQIRLPLTIHVCRLVWRNFVILIHSLPVVVIVVIVFGHRPSWSLLLLPFGVFILTLNILWATIFLGILSTRFRDILPIMTNFMQIAFFLTPIMWSPSNLHERFWIAEYNPFYHLIEIIRAPILGAPFELNSWILSIALTIFGMSIAQFTLIRCRNHLAYWL